MRERLAEARGDSTSAGEQMGEAVRASKKICIRMISNKSSTFSGGVGRDTQGSHGRFDASHRGSRH